MQTRIQANNAALLALGARSLPLTAAERLNCGWARVDDHQAILDMACENSALLKHYLDLYRIRACGLSNDLAQADRIRDALPEAEVVFSAYDDIPWQDDTFDVVLISRRIQGNHQAGRMFGELFRVMRSGGQLVMTFRTPPLLRSGRPFFSSLEVNREADCRGLPDRLSSAGFCDISWRRSKWAHTTLIAYKNTPA